MKILGFSFSVKKQPGPGARLSVIEESLRGHTQFLEAMAGWLVQVEKKAEATRRKVYRDAEEPVPRENGEPAPVVNKELGPGDILEPGDLP